MTDYYVHNTRTGGSNNGTSWVNAWTNITSVTGLSGTDRVFVASGHQQTDATSIAIPGTSGSTPAYRYISVDETGDPEPPAATDYEDMVTGGGYIEVTGTGNDISFAEGGDFYGLFFRAQDDININGNWARQLFFHDCTFDYLDADGIWTIGSNGQSYLEFESCTFRGLNTAADNDGGLNIQSGRVRFVSCTWEECSYKDVLFSGLNTTGFVVFTACDFTTYGNQTTPKLKGTGNTAALVRFEGCQMPTDTGWDFSDQGANGVERIIIIGSDGVNNDRENTQLLDFRGKLHTWGGSNTARQVYRTDGFTPPDQTNPICWRVLASDSTNKINYGHPFELPPMSTWNDTTGSTVTVTCEFLLGDASAVDPLDNDEIWIRVDYYDDASSTQLKSEWTRPATILTTPTAETTAGSTWTTTDAETATTAYKIEHTTGSNVGRKGPIQVTWFIADLGTNDAIYIDPILTLS